MFTTIRIDTLLRAIRRISALRYLFIREEPRKIVYLEFLSNHEILAHIRVDSVTQVVIGLE